MFCSAPKTIKNARQALREGRLNEAKGQLETFINKKKVCSQVGTARGLLQDVQDAIDAKHAASTQQAIAAAAPPRYVATPTPPRQHSPVRAHAPSVRSKASIEDYEAPAGPPPQQQYTSPNRLRPSPRPNFAGTNNYGYASNLGANNFAAQQAMMAAQQDETMAEFAMLSGNPGLAMMEEMQAQNDLAFAQSSMRPMMGNRFGAGFGSPMMGLQQSNLMFQEEMIADELAFDMRF